MTKETLCTAAMVAETLAEEAIAAETVEKLVRDADAALDACQALFGKVEGATKLKKRIVSELKFLQSLNKEPLLELSQVQSSNMRHLLGILHVATSYPDVSHVLKNVSTRKRETGKEEEEESFSITVDVMCNKGSSWVKVIARNAQALHLIWAGRGHYGTNTLFFQAEDYLQLGRENPINYATPTVTFVFFNGVATPMAEALQDLGVSVVGRREAVSEETRARLEALTDDDDDDDEDDDRREKRLRSESSCSDEEIGDESLEGEYVVGEDSNVDDDDDDLDGKLAGVTRRTENCDSLSVTSITLDSSLSSQPEPIAPVVASTIVASNAAIVIATVTKDLDPYSVPRTVGQKRHENPRIFLDISTMIAMTSALCNGNADYVFQDKILSEQAERERAEPMLPTVDPVLEGKQLFTCQMAADDFRKILSIMGGPEENTRGERLLASLTIVPDAPSTRSLALKESASIKARAKVIFGTADSLKALTCSANSGFVRAAAGQGVNFVVHIHQSRALTEEKQKTASKIDPVKIEEIKSIK